MKNYRCITSVQEIQQYISNAAVVAFDYETAPDEPYRIEEKAALDPQKNHMTGCSFSVKEYTGIYVPVAHKVGENIEPSDAHLFSLPQRTGFIPPQLLPSCRDLR